MRLFELFNDEHEMTIQQQLTQTALDFITPLLANNVPFITVQSVIDALRQSRPGILVDRSFVFDLLDPDTVKAVSKIEGDRIYLQSPGTDDEHKAGEDETARQIDKIKGDAMKKAQKDVVDANASPKVPAGK